jgi:hypothetical protein
MHQSTLRRAITRLCRNARLCLPALALALTLGAIVGPPPPANGNPSPIAKPVAVPQVNWNS